MKGNFQEEEKMKEIPVRETKKCFTCEDIICVKTTDFTTESNTTFVVC